MISWINLFDEVIKNRDDQFLLLGTWESFEFGGHKDETGDNWWNIFFGKSVIDVLDTKFFNCLDYTFGCNFTSIFL